MSKDLDDTKQCFEEAYILLDNLRQSVATPAEAMFVLCVAMFILDKDYRKPEATTEDCIKLITDSFREIEVSHSATH